MSIVFLTPRTPLLHGGHTGGPAEAVEVHKAQRPSGRGQAIRFSQEGETKIAVAADALEGLVSHSGSFVSRC